MKALTPTPPSAHWAGQTASLLRANQRGKSQGVVPRTSFLPGLKLARRVRPFRSMSYTLTLHQIEPPPSECFQERLSPEMLEGGPSQDSHG